MSEDRTPHWDARSATIDDEPLAAYDRLRAQSPVAWDDRMGWTIFRNHEIREVLAHPGTFSNRVSRHLSVPNGMDPPEHTAYRRLIEPYFGPDTLAHVEPALRRIAADLADRARQAGSVEFITAFCEPFAARAQCAFMGWPGDRAPLLADWTRRNQQATRDRDRSALASIAGEFEDLVGELLQARRKAGAEAPDDNTTRLMNERVNGRHLTDEEITSILRNWTVGEVGTLTASLGVIGHFLAQHPDVQSELRADSERIPDAVEEILRLHGPLLANRRVATEDTTIGGCPIAAGDAVTLLWVPANRDPGAFDDAQTYRPDRDQSANLLWGEGLHYCPGAPLARLELHIAVEALLAATGRLQTRPDEPPRPAMPPASGFARVPLDLATDGSGGT